MGTKAIWDGEQLPPVGSEVLIHLARPSAWVRHTVAGYEIGAAHPEQKIYHIVNILLEKSDDPRSWKNQRFLSEVRPLDWRPGEDVSRH